MSSPQERRLAGLEYLEAVTALLQRIRAAHPTAGLWEAADRQWSWRNERSSDVLPQLFWFDESDQPVAAAILTHSPYGSTFDPIVMPDTPPELLPHVIERGLAHAAASGFDTIEVEVDKTDDVMRTALFAHGLESVGDAVVEAWIDAAAIPEISSLHDDYRLSSRAHTMDRPHHMTNAERGHTDAEPRLLQTSLYRPDLDLVVHHNDGAVAGYGLFWFDPTTFTGLVEPMRTEDDHQRRGLARHILTAGLHRLVAAGAERIKICYEPDNPAAGDLYLDVGFEPDRHNEIITSSTTSS